MDVDHPQEADTTTVTMTAAVEVMVEVVMIIVEAIAEMIVIVATAEIAMMDTLLVWTDINAMTAIAAEVAMTDVEEVEDILIVMTEEIVVTVVQPVMLHQQPAMATLLLEKLGNHTEVEATMMKDSPVVNIDC
jgi:hypothetical protein